MLRGNILPSGGEGGNEEGAWAALQFIESGPGAKRMMEMSTKSSGHVLECEILTADPSFRDNSVKMHGSMQLA
jgi:hypothetical protein